MKFPGTKFVAIAAVFILVSFATNLSFAAERQSKLTEDERNTVELFKRVSPGVVHISASRTVTSPFEKQTSESSTGTGFVIDTEGRVLTAFHVIKEMNEIAVVLGTRRLTARLIGTAPQLDIALLQVDAPREELVPLTLGTSQDLEVGQKVLAIGNAAGLHNSLTVGVVSAIKRSLDGTAIELEDAFIQTDAAINPGNSGGPLFNSAGEVVGINDAVLANTQNMGFAIPIELARSIIPDLIEMGHPYRPVLGFSGGELTTSIAKLFGLPLDHGFLVEEVLPGSPAQSAGLRAGSRIVMISDKPFVLGGDIILGVNGEPFTSSAQLAQILLHSRPGQRLRLKVYRQGQAVEVELPLERMQMQF